MRLIQKYLLIVFLSSGLAAFADDWYVATNGTGQGTSWADATGDLKGAVAACASGSTVWVSNGYYTAGMESGDFLTLGSGVTVRSKTGLPGDVIFDGAAMGRTVTMGSGSWVVGCTMQGGIASEGGNVSGGSLLNCIIQGGSAWGGACAKDCTLYCCIIRNHCYGFVFLYCTLYNSLITGNSFIGDLICFYNCTITGNLGNPNSSGCSFVNSISFGNAYPDDMNPEYLACAINSCGINFTNGVGNITNNPLFVSASDFRLGEGSPCINAGSNTVWDLSETLDLNGNNRIWPYDGKVDMGAYEYGWPSNFFFPVFGISIN